MDIFIQQVINGLTLGAVYAMVALGYTMVYGIIQLINFAHGEVVMIGAMVAGLAALVYRTRLGTAMRATAHNPQVAGLMGIDSNRIIALTFVIGAALAAVAGVMVASYYGIAHYAMGSQLGLKAFCAAVLGGIGNIPGAMLGGVLLGVVEALGAGYIGDLTGNVFGSNYQDVFAFIVLIAVLVLRPSGLLGERVGDRA